MEEKNVMKTGRYTFVAVPTIPIEQCFFPDDVNVGAWLYPPKGVKRTNKHLPRLLAAEMLKMPQHSLRSQRQMQWDIRTRCVRSGDKGGNGFTVEEIQFISDFRERLKKNPLSLPLPEDLADWLDGMSKGRKGGRGGGVGEKRQIVLEMARRFPESGYAAETKQNGYHLLARYRKKPRGLYFAWEVKALAEIKAAMG